MSDPIRETIVVTGASSGIGRHLAIQLSKPGCEIWLVGRDRARLDQVADQIRVKGASPCVLVTDLSEIETSGRVLMDNFPANKKVDAVYLAAAITLFGEVRHTQNGDWDQIYRTNLLSPVQWTRHFYQGMAENRSGTIVIVSSLAAYSGYPTATAYATMKAGLVGLFRSLWHEGRQYGVNFHLASPGYVDTSIYRSAIYRETTYEETIIQIGDLGFKIIGAEESAEEIIRKVQQGKPEFAFPTYAFLMKWIAPRMPFLIDIVHSRIVKRFRRSA